MNWLSGIVFSALLLLMAPAVHASAPAEVGSAQMIRGTVTAQLQEQDPRSLEKTSPIFETDMIKTGAKSFAVIKLKDGTRITIRPDSQLGIKKYTFEEGQEEEAEYNLVKGGMRALTGLMGKSNPDATRVKTEYATMGIRGTSYDVRLCDASCVAEQQQKSGVKELTSLVVGRAVNLKGEVTVSDKNGVSRTLTEGGPVYAGDRVRTSRGGSALLVFRDNTRLALMANSDLVLNDYSYQSEGADRFDAKLARGDVQVKPGHIGQDSPSSFQVQHKDSKIGAEGTAFTADEANIVVDELFSTQDHDFSRTGTYVTVYDGHVNVRRPRSSLAGYPMVASLELLSGFELLLAQGGPGSSSVDLGAGESAFADEESLYRLDKAPLFLTEDCIPHPDDLADDSIWPPIYFKGDNCAAFYASFTGTNSPSIEGGPLFPPGVELPSSPDRLPPEPPVPPKPPVPPVPKPPVSGQI